MVDELTISPSQLETEALCTRKWAFERIADVWEDECDDPEDPAVLGSEIHRQMEIWGKTGQLPTHPAAQALVDSGYCIPPGIGECEVQIRYRLTSGPFKGYIDNACSLQVMYDGQPGGVCKLGTTDYVLLHDYKSIGASGKPKTVEYLKKNLAVNIYAADAFLGGAEKVFCNWIYVQRSAPFKVSPVWFEVDRTENSAFMATVDAHSAGLQRLFKLKVDPNSLPANEDSCFAYRRRCHAWHLCDAKKHEPRILKPSRLLGKKDPMTDTDFIAHVNAVTTVPAVPRIPPPVPPLPATVPVAPVAPPLPPVPSTDVQKNAAKVSDSFKALFDDHLADTPVGVPESGYVNPPGGPTVAPKTPEEAAQLQGIEPPVVHDDDLEAADLATLKGIAKTLGIDLPPRTRSKSYVDAIRAARAQVTAPMKPEAFDNGMERARAIMERDKELLSRLDDNSVMDSVAEAQYNSAVIWLLTAIFLKLGIIANKG